jgi:hypothetical protein
LAVLLELAPGLGLRAVGRLPFESCVVDRDDDARALVGIGLVAEGDSSAQQGGETSGRIRLDQPLQRADIQLCSFDLVNWRRFLR